MPVAIQLSDTMPTSPLISPASPASSSVVFPPAAPPPTSLHLSSPVLSPVPLTFSTPVEGTNSAENVRNVRSGSTMVAGEEGTTSSAQTTMSVDTEREKPNSGPNYLLNVCDLLL